MSTKRRIFPFECCRCGFCCLSITCAIGMKFYGIEKKDRCPGLSFNKKGIASCALAGIVPINDGCCIKARCFKDYVEYDFASLPKEMKYKIVKSIMAKNN